MLLKLSGGSLSTFRTYHDIEKGVPHQPSLDDHGRCDQRGKQSAQAVEAVQETQQMSCVLHGSDPCVPACVLITATEAGQDEYGDDNGERRVGRNDDVGNQPCEWRDGSSSPAAEPERHAIVDQRGCDIAEKRREEDQEHYGVVLDVVVCLELDRFVSLAQEKSVNTMVAVLHMESTAGQKQGQLKTRMRMERRSLPRLDMFLFSLRQSTHRACH